MRKTYPMRARIRDEGSGPARVDIYDDIGAGGWFSEGYTPASFADAIKGVSGPLDVHINSAGGDVSDGIAIASAIRNYPGKKRTVVDGVAASIASVIAQAGDERVVEPGAMLMIHDPFTGLVGNADELRKTADTLDKHGDNLAKQYADRSGTKSAAEWRDTMKAETWYTAEDAVEAGLADKVGSGSAALPQGVDLESLAASAPGRIMAALRSLPRADAGTAKCKTCKGRGRLKHPGTGKDGMKCPACGGAGTYAPDADPGGSGDGAQGALRAKSGKPYEPLPYHRSPDENVQCPKCEKYSDDDARFCGQCGTQLVGRDDVEVAPMAPASAGLTEERVRAILAEEVARRAAVLPRDAGKVDNSPWDGSKAMAAGAASDDPAAFYAGICAGKKDGNPSIQDSWALPYRYAPGDPPNAAGVKNALARLPQTQGLTNEAEAKKTLQAAMKQVNPDWEPDDSLQLDLSGVDLEKIANGLKGAIK